MFYLLTHTHTDGKLKTVFKLREMDGLKINPIKNGDYVMIVADSCEWYSSWVKHGDENFKLYIPTLADITCVGIKIEESAQEVENNFKEKVKSGVFSRQITTQFGRSPSKKKIRDMSKTWNKDPLNHIVVAAKKRVPMAKYSDNLSPQGLTLFFCPDRAPLTPRYLKLAVEQDIKYPVWGQPKEGDIKENLADNQIIGSFVFFYSSSMASQAAKDNTREFVDSVSANNVSVCEKVLKDENLRMRIMFEFLRPEYIDTAMQQAESLCTNKHFCEFKNILVSFLESTRNFILCVVDDHHNSL